MSKIVRDEDGRWYKWCERNQCPRDAFDDEACEVLDLLMGAKYE